MFEQQYVLNKIEQWAERLPPPHPICKQRR